MFLPRTPVCQHRQWAENHSGEDLSVTEWTPFHRESRPFQITFSPLRLERTSFQITSVFCGASDIGNQQTTVSGEQASRRRNGILASSSRLKVIVFGKGLSTIAK